MPWHEAHDLEGTKGTLHLSMATHVYTYIYMYICPDLQDFTDTGNYNHEPR